LASILGGAEQSRFAAHRAKLIAERVPESLATHIASLDAMHGALDVVEVSRATRLSIADAARAYFDLGERIGLAWIKQQIESLPAEGHWHSVARSALRDDLYALQRKITGAALAHEGSEPRARVDRWIGAHATEIAYLKGLIGDIGAGSAPDFATLSVALQSVRRLAGP
jgi:glutamate dehydrogenase